MLRQMALLGLVLKSATVAAMTTLPASPTNLMSLMLCLLSAGM